MINIKTFVFNDFQINTYILSNENNECIIIDPGCYYDVEKTNIKLYIAQNHLKPVLIINTHGHIDHIIGNCFFQNEYHIPVAANKLDEPLFKSIKEYGAIFGIKMDSLPVIDKYIDEKEKLQFGGEELQIIHVPGHSPGSIALFCHSANFVIVGDVLFYGSIGRTDMPGGNYQTIMNSIKNSLLTLPDNAIVYPGHGPYTTIENERNNNPFLI